MNRKSTPVHKNWEVKSKMANSQTHLWRWWKVAKPHKGLVVRTLAPTTSVIGPLFENLPQKIMHRVKPNFWFVVPPFAGAYMRHLGERRTIRCTGSTGAR